jgi:hypothetical protein
MKMALDEILENYKRLAEQHGEMIQIDSSPRDPILYRFENDGAQVDYMVFPENEESLAIYQSGVCLYDSSAHPSGTSAEIRELSLGMHYRIISGETALAKKKLTELYQKHSSTK